MAPKKRTPPTSSGSAQASKKAKLDSYNDGVGESEIDDTVLSRLLDAVRESDQVPLKHVSKDSTVVYWMRNKDIRLEDNHALALAAQEAKKHSVPLIALHILSPGDYKAHDRGPPRVDFMLRAMRTVRSQLAERHIPLVVEQWDPPRKSIPSRLSERLRDWNAAYVFANLEYEVDELRRDTELTMLATAARQGKDKDKGKGKGEWQGQPFFLKDFCIVGPGECLTKQGKAYSVYSPWYRNWCSHVTEDLQSYTQDYGLPEPNDPSVRQHELVKKLFEVEVPAKVEGWEMDKDRRAHLEQLWPTDAGAAEKVLMRFCKTKICAAKFDGPPLEEDGEEVPMNKRKIGVYSTERNRPDLDGTSHISPYLASGLISPRRCLRATLELTKGRLHTGRDSGIGSWVGELGFRDFYQHVLVAFPRVSMGKPFNLKYENVVWEYDDDKLQAWKDGRTGFPLVDAGMRQLKDQAYMHNRVRMCVAMCLTKDLLLDWHEGEKYFARHLIDADLGSNNGGWQWSASTGTDPQPYFRVFNPTSQSEKSDLTGDYIRHYVPELRGLEGKALHDPSSHLSSKELEKRGYPKPIVDHASARKRAIARYKNPGTDANE